MNDALSAMHPLHRRRGAVFLRAGEAELPVRYGDPLVEYEAAHATAALTDVGCAGKVLFTGDGCRDFLQRLLTNDLSTSTPGHVVPACLLTVHGKLVADFWLHDRPSDFLAVSLDPAAPGRVLASLAKHLALSEIEARDVSSSYSAFFVMGPKAAFLLEKVFGRAFPAALAVAEIPWRGKSLWASRSPIFGAEGFLLLVDPGLAPEVWEACEEAGRPLGLSLLGGEAAEMIRVEAGVVRYGVDVDGGNYPVEAGLVSHISGEKGCYLGQETTARLTFKGRPPRKLVAVRTAAPAAPGDPVLLDGREAARVTSAVRSPRLGAALSLCLFPTEAAQEGRAVTVGGRPGLLVPFPGRR